MEMRAPKGVFDVYPRAKERWQDSALWQFIENIAKNQAELFNFKEIRTPIFEHLELFHKGVGEGSDIVSKEMYQFQDKAGRELALRPEGTAAVIRAYLENKLYSTEKSSKLFYIGPMFRYERQQSGRYRQHHQFGAEAIGISSPYQDVEIIDLAMSLYKAAGLNHLNLLINCVGSPESRQSYIASLKEFLEPQFDSLSEDSKARFHKNMLRILDSKDPQDQKLLSGCPNILDFLDDQKKDHFDTVCSKLKDLGISYKIEPKLVRGLDYYDSTVFEIISTHDSKTPLSLGGGGRYDGLISTYGGPQTPAVGFGTGIERIIQTLIAQNNFNENNLSLDAYIIPMQQDQFPHAYQLAHTLRAHNLSVDIDLMGRKLKNAIPQASHLGARFAIILGEDELKQGLYNLKNLVTRQELNLKKDAIVDYISKHSM